MGRAIVREPKAFLMDEPLSNLDAKLRGQMRAEIARIQQTLQVTTLYVTHDQVEAMTMGHRVAVMSDGVLQQIDTPQRIYDAPVNLFVASFVGSPPMNLLEAEVVRDGEGLVLRSGSTEIALPRDVAVTRPQLDGLVGRRIVVGIRPETVLGSGIGAAVRGRVLLVEALGAEQLVHIEVPAVPLGRQELVDAARETDVSGFGSDDGRRATILGRFDRNALLRAGEAAEVFLDPAQLHFFDLETGAALERVEAPVVELAR
jgi:multiple sugar transport system ATP-binding protein